MENKPLLADHLEDQILRGRLRLIVKQNAATFVAANLVSPILITILLWLTGDSIQNLLPWVGFGLLLCTARALHHHELKKFSASSKPARQWEFELILLSMISGFFWAASAILFLDPENPELSIFIIAAIFAHISMSMASHASHIRIFTAFSLSVWLPACCFFLVTGTGFYYQIAILGSFFVLANFSFALNHSKSVTESLKLQYENTSLLNELKQQKTIAVEASRAKSRFMAAASHDLRQPLHAMHLFADSLSKRAEGAETKRILAMLRSSMNTLRELFDSLMDLSRLDAGVIKPHVKTFNLELMLIKLVHEYSIHAENKGLTLRSRLFDCWVKSDAALVEQILRNLIWNAIKYTDEGSILVACRRRAGKVVVEVWDTGTGISIADQQHIFDEFHQANNPDRDRSQGIGLGLSIVQRTARLLQLEVSVSSSLGKGSKFTVGFKTVEPPKAWHRTDQHADKELDADLNGVSVLVVDDEIAILQALEIILTDWGCKVIAVRGLKEVRDALDEFSPDIVLTDFRLQNNDTGSMVINEVQDSMGFEIPAIIITGTSFMEPMGLGHRYHAILHKPVRAKQLRAKMVQILNI